MNIEEYMLSDSQRIQSVSARLFAALVDNKKTGCLEWSRKSKANGGYGVLCVGRKGHIRAHRAAWAIKNGAIPDGFYVCHKCDNPLCCNTDHLFLGTPKDNMADKEAKGRGIKPPVRHGELHHNTKTTLAEVDCIKSENGTLNEIADRYGISSKTVWRIKKGLSWKT
jgi:hypothetical protein